jgi:stage II sporulation protein AA (anti-sigma F factor antagonist)
MEIREERAADVLIVAPTGRLDTTTSTDLERHLLARLDANERRLVLDLTGIEYVSSAGLRVLLFVAKRLKATSGDLVLCGLGPAVRQVFELAGFVSLFRVEASRAQALASLVTSG